MTFFVSVPFFFWGGGGGALVVRRSGRPLGLVVLLNQMDQMLMLIYVLPVTSCSAYSCSSTQSLGSVLPSIFDTRDQNSRGCPLLFSNRNLGSFCA